MFDDSDNGGCEFFDARFLGEGRFVVCLVLVEPASEDRLAHIHFSADRGDSFLLQYFTLGKGR
jgi:hypothetical protein